MSSSEWNPGTYEEITAVQGAKRLGNQWCPWMGDWFTSWSPRNDNNNAEGTWDHWVDLAILILQDPLTGLVRPDAHRVAAQLAAIGFYDESGRNLTDEELRERFEPKPAAERDATAAGGRGETGGGVNET